MVGAAITATETKNGESLRFCPLFPRILRARQNCFAGIGNIECQQKNGGTTILHLLNWLIATLRLWRLQITLLHDWHTIGLRGSGSTSVAVKDVFVPNERIALLSETLQEDYASTHLRDEPLYRLASILVKFPDQLISSNRTKASIVATSGLTRLSLVTTQPLRLPTRD
jgi:hypothetical protein